MSDSVLEAVFGAFEHAPDKVRLNGRGESTIHPRFSEILIRIKRAWPDSELHLFTNLTYPKSSRIELLKEYGVQLFVSLDSDDADELFTIRRGAKLDVIEKNIKSLEGISQRPFIVFTLQYENAHRIESISRFAERHRFGIIYNVVRSDRPDHRLKNLVLSQYERILNDFKNAYKTMDEAKLPCFIPDQIQGISLGFAQTKVSNGSRKSCIALEREVCIQYDGTVTPCNMFHPEVLGHIHGSSISSILSGPAASRFRLNHKLSEYCKNCAWLGGES